MKHYGVEVLIIPGVGLFLMMEELEFENILQYGTAGQAIGIKMFTSNSVSKDEKKTETMKKAYTGWAKKK